MRLLVTAVFKVPIRCTFALICCIARVALYLYSVHHVVCVEQLPSNHLLHDSCTVKKKNE
jgi:hypothetical protein